MKMRMKFLKMKIEEMMRTMLMRMVEMVKKKMMKMRMMKMMLVTEEDWRCPSSLSCPPCQSSRRPPPLLLALDAIDHDGWSDGDDDGVNDDVSEAHLAP